MDAAAARIGGTVSQTAALSRGSLSRRTRQPADGAPRRVPVRG
jgi:hypothetical protein